MSCYGLGVAASRLEHRAQETCRIGPSMDIGKLACMLQMLTIPALAPRLLARMVYCQS